MLRSVPGLNVIQMSARDINLTARQATSTLATSQLVWSTAARSTSTSSASCSGTRALADPGEIKQIEVVRGPASAVWGANALTGVVNIITKTPRENEGFGIVLGAGALRPRRRLARGGRRRLPVQRQLLVRQGDQRHLVVPADRRLLQLRPVLAPDGPDAARLPSARDQPVPLGERRALPGGVPIGGATYPADANQPGAFENQGTSQPKFGLRFDQDLATAGASVQGGYAGTEGIVHTGIGPFGLQSGSYMAYGRVAYTKGALRVSALRRTSWTPRPRTCSSADPNTLGPIMLDFKTQTYDFEVGNTNVLGGQAHLHLRRQRAAEQLRHLARARATTAPSSAPTSMGDLRRQVPLRARRARRQVRQHRRPGVLAARQRRCSSPRPTHAFRASYNRAFRLAVVHQQLPEPGHPVPAGRSTCRRSSRCSCAGGPLLAPPPFFPTVNAFGNPDMKESSTRLRARATPARSAARPRSGSRSTRTTRTTTSTSPTSTRRARRATRRRRTTT